MAFLCKTTHLTPTSCCALNIPMLPSHFLSQAPVFIWTLTLLCNMNWILAHTFISHQRWNGIPRLCILHQSSLWIQKCLTMALMSSQVYLKFHLYIASRQWWKPFMSFMIPTADGPLVQHRLMFLVSRHLFQRGDIQQSLLKNSASIGVLGWLNPNRHSKLPLSMESVWPFYL